MKKLFIVLSLFCVPSILLAQQCEVSTTYTTQSQIDGFITDYPNCTSILGTITINITDNADAISNVDAFSNITEILGGLIIQKQQDQILNTVDLSGFSNINTISQNLSITDHPNTPVINDLIPFSNLTNVGSIFFKDLNAISNLDIFNNLTTLESLYLDGKFSLLNSTLFPNLENVQELTIWNFIAQEISGFNALETISGTFSIDYYDLVGTPGLMPFNLDAFHNLTTISYLQITAVPAITFSAFELLSNCSVIEITTFADFTLPDFPSLTNSNQIFLGGESEYIPAFPQLSQVNTLLIEGNFHHVSFPILQTVNNYISIQAYLNYPNAEVLATETLELPVLQFVANNFSLSYLNISDLGTPNLINVGGNIQINNCPNLSLCNHDFICNKILTEPLEIDIHDNGIGCSDITEISLYCGSLFIQGNVYVDINCDGSLDSNDIMVNNPIIIDNANNPIGASNSLGEYVFIPQQNTSYTFSPAAIPGTTNASAITITTGTGSASYLDNNFPLCPDLLYHDIAVTALSWNMSPGFESTIFFHIENLSYNSETVSLNSVLSLLNVMVINSSSHPYSTSLNTITFDDFTIGAGETITVTLNVTLDASIQLGTLNSIQADVTSSSSEVDLTNNQDSFQNIVIGSYDPNDITVDREAIDYTQVDQDGEWLVYQIRFQNTGTAPAQFINVVNEQDLNLDMSTIDMIAASHSYELIFNGREITWFFDNIQLPDSTTDLLGSQGYILFRIKTNPGITLDEVIESSAAIYFDYNEPVITNTASTVFYVCPEIPSITQNGNTLTASGSGTFTWFYNDQLLNDTDNSIEFSESGDYSVSITANGCTSETSQSNFTYLGINENDLMKMSAFPNPFTDIISLQLPAQTEKITVTDVSGKIVFEKNNIVTSSIQLDLSFLDAGSYFITVNSASGAVSEVIVKGVN